QQGVSQGKIDAALAGLGNVKVPVFYKEKLSTGPSDITSIGVEMKSLSEVRPQLFAGKGNMKERGKIEPNVLRNVDNNILDIMELAGGHTIERHVSKTSQELIRRAIKEDVDAATSYANKAIATKAVQENLRKNANEIAKWLNESDT